MTRLRCAGTTFNVDKAGGGTVYTKIGQCESIGQPSPSNSPVDDTDLDSVIKEYSAGLVDGGQIAVDLRFDPSDEDHAFLETWAWAPDKKSVKISLPTKPKATLKTFDAIPVSFDSPGGANEDKLNATLTLQITSVPVTTTET